METVLLVDDEDVFKAVEGTCLRREKCRLVKSPPDRLLARALASSPDLMILSASDEISRRLLEEICRVRTLSNVPIIALDFRPDQEASSGARTPGRKAGVEVVSVPRRQGGPTDHGELDRRLEAAIRRCLPVLDRRNDRVTISLAVQVKGPSGSFRLRTKNISPTGLFIRTDRSFSPGQRVVVRFRLPEESDSVTAEAIEGACEVVRKVGGRKGDDDLIPGVGLRFIDLHEPARRHLRRYVQRLAAEGPAPAH